MSKKQEEGKLPGYAPDLNRYCTTCACVIQYQAVKKSKRCPNGHAVDLREKWEKDWSRCTYCDNYIRACHCYCSTCAMENDQRDLQRRIRLEKKNEMELMWKMVKKMNLEAKRFGLQVSLKDTGDFVMYRMSPGPLPLALCPAPTPESASSPSEGERSSQASQQSLASTRSIMSFTCRIRGNGHPSQSSTSTSSPGSSVSPIPSTSRLGRTRSQSLSQASRMALEPRKDTRRGDVKIEEIHGGTAENELDDSDFLHVSSEALAVPDAEMEEVKPPVKDEFKIKVEVPSDTEEINDEMDVDMDFETVPVEEKSSKKRDVENKSTRRSSRKRTSATMANQKHETPSDVIVLSDDGETLPVVTKEVAEQALKNLTHKTFRQE